MRVYKDKKLTKVVCNNCGKNIKVNNSTIEEGVFFADYKQQEMSAMITIELFGIKMYQLDQIERNWKE